MSLPLPPTPAVGGEKKDKKEKKEDKKKDKGEWEMLTDAYGRSYW